MKNYGTEMRGPLLLEDLPSLPSFTESDVGRVVFSSGEVYFNDSTNYINIAGTNKDNAFTGSNNFSGELQISGQNLSPVSNFKNKIINGNFDFWQRQTSQTSSGYASDDRWGNIHSGSTKTHSRQAFTVGQTDVSGNPEYYSRTVITTGSGSGDYVIKQQKIESVYTFSGKTVILSFWAKADSSKYLTIEFLQYFGSGGSPSSDVNTIGVTKFSLTTSWQKFTTSVFIPSISGKTLGTDGNDHLRLLFWLDAGSTYNSRTDTLGNQSGTFDIAQVQLEEGSVATPFEQRPLGVEISLCQRYYCKTYNKGAIPGAAVAAGRRGVYSTGHNSSDHTALGVWEFPVKMRTAPSVTIYSHSTGASNKVAMASGDVTPASTSTSDSNFLVSADNGAASTVRALFFQGEADAEL